MGRTTVLIILHGSKQPVLGASARRPILVYQAATSEEELRRIPLLRGWMNKYHQASLRFLVDDEHALAKAVRSGTEAGLGVQMLRPKLFELLVCVGKLAGRERFTSTGIHYDAHSVSFFDEPLHQAHRARRRAGAPIRTPAHRLEGRRGLGEAGPPSARSALVAYVVG
jgi:hypothetical protein